MQIRSPRTILAMSAAVALAAAALAPTAALAKGPGPGAGSCSGDCPNDQAQVQLRARAQDATGGQAQKRTRARDDSAQRTATQANTGGGQQVRARAADVTAPRQQAVRASRGNTAAKTGAVAGARSAGQPAGQGLGRGPDGDWQQAPGECPECSAEMGELTDEQVAGLIYMANEEKLAHDVYASFAEQYGLRSFERIAASEERHLLAVRTVLERYGIEDPTAALGAGEYSVDALTELYVGLMEQGSAGLEEALDAAVTIEQTDIADLEARRSDLAESAPDVFALYQNLQRASGYHLAAFEGQL